MFHIVADDINELLHAGALEVLNNGITEDTRNGPVLRLPGPLVTEWTNPRKRVLFSVIRDANPFFHLMEALWMLAGRDDVAFVSKFNSRIAEFSDDGVKFHGPYGHRWRHAFHMDQLEVCVQMLRHNPSDRRVVMAMWHPLHDLNHQGKDIPCNTHIYFSTVRGVLDMTVCNRSNDMIWGLYGANAVHMSIMMELVARATGLELGTMYTLSNNAHFYPNNFKYSLEDIVDEEPTVYLDGASHSQVLFKTMDGYKLFLKDCEDLCAGTHPAPRTEFFRDTIFPMYRAWECHKNGNTKMAKKIAEKEVQSIDWGAAAAEWLGRRIK